MHIHCFRGQMMHDHIVMRNIKLVFMLTCVCKRYEPGLGLTSTGENKSRLYYKRTLSRIDPCVTSRSSSSSFIIGYMMELCTSNYKPHPFICSVSDSHELVGSLCLQMLKRLMQDSSLAPDCGKIIEGIMRFIEYSVFGVVDEKVPSSRNDPYHIRILSLK